MVQRKNIKRVKKEEDLGYIRKELEDVAKKLTNFKEQEEISRKLESAIDRLIISIDQFNNKEPV